MYIMSKKGLGHSDHITLSVITLSGGVHCYTHINRHSMIPDPSNAVQQTSKPTFSLRTK